jgi:hypothetical protein
VSGYADIARRQRLAAKLGLQTSDHGGDLRDNLDPARPIPESLRKRYLQAVERLEAVSG